jgi:signal recognition particle receptor subunit beta
MSTLDPILEFLPPPVVVLIRHIDSVVPNGSFLILCTIVSLFVIKALVTSFTSTSVIDVLGAVPEDLKDISSTCPSVVLLGPSGSGKTVLYNSLLEGSPSPVSTLTSLKISSSEVSFGGKKATLIDHPGHSRLASTIKPTLSTCLPNSMLVFTINSASPGQMSTAARLLYDIILTNASAQANIAHMLVLCTHSAMPLAKSAIRVKTAINVEMERFRRTDVTLASTGEEKARQVIEPGNGKSLDIEKDAGCDVTVMRYESSEAESVKKVEEWIGACLKATGGK